MTAAQHATNAGSIPLPGRKPACGHVVLWEASQEPPKRLTLSDGVPVAVIHTPAVLKSPQAPSREEKPFPAPVAWWGV